MSNAPFPIDPVLTGLAIAYRNKDYIADLALPRFQPVLTKKEFKYYVHTKAERFTPQNTLVGRRSAPSEVEFTATEVPGVVKDYGLDDPIPYDDIRQAPEGWDLEGSAVANITDLIGLDREKRCADILFAAATYPSGNKDQCTGAEQWSHADATPITDINEALDVPLLRPNTMVIGQAAWSILSVHPHVIKAVQGNAGDRGIATRQQVAQLFELDQVLVGRARINAAKKGQSASYSAIWGKHCALLHLDSMAQGDGRRATFGGTFQYDTRVAGAEDDSKIGPRGGRRVRVVESVVETVTAADLGYFFEDAVA